MTQSDKKVAFISGANRGIGYEAARRLGELGIIVVIGSREIARGETAARELVASGIDAVALQYDATQSDAPERVYEFIERRFGKLDILVNNAGVLMEDIVGQNDTSTVSQTVLRSTFETNLFAVVDLTQKLLPLIRKSPSGRIVNISSILGSQTLHSMPESPIEQAKGLAYNASKAALNTFTIHLAHDLRDTAIKVNSAHPGWVKTELGGPNAPMEIEDSWKTTVRLATLDAAGPTGGFFHEDSALPW